GSAGTAKSHCPVVVISRWLPSKRRESGLCFGGELATSTPRDPDENDPPHACFRFFLRVHVSSDRSFMGAITRNVVAQRNPEHVQAGHLQLRLCEARCHDPDARRRQAAYCDRDSQGGEECSYPAHADSV